MDMKTTANNRQRKHGYSLVEISLAMLVIGVGLLAALALFPEGLGSATRAVEDVAMLTFAQNVFSSLALEAGDTNMNWSTFQSDLELMWSHSLEGTEDGTQPIVRVLPNANSVSNYFWIPDWYSSAQANMPQHRTATFTYSLVIGPSPGGAVGRYARLEVWPGEYPAGTRPTSRGRVFYREFMPPK